ncbi:hypothetical protein KP509_30G072900 [Ceratopteris richardii]|nr:hypothetical protein KP509_30G072900 [Ceratopteris richardii]
MESASDPKNTQVLSTEADEDIRLLENRKQLKRLNCMKLPPSVSFLDETLSEPPSAKSSPKAWLQRAGSSVLTGSPDLRQAMLKSKGIFRTKKKKEPQSVPSSPLCTDAEATSSCSIVTDESDSEKSVRPVRVFRKSKFRPVLSRSNEMDATEKNIGILDQGRSGNYPSENVQIQKIPELFDSLIMKKINKESDHSEDAGKRKGSNKGRDDNVAGAGKGKMKMIGLNKPFSENEGIHAQSKASNARSLKEIEKSVFFGTGKGPVHRTGGMFQSSSKPSTIATSTKARSDYTRSATGSLLRPSVRREGRSRQQIVSIGNAWLAAGLTIIMAGLLKGRIIAMAGLICYWYILSFCRKRYNIVQS